jgi:hypothetical protein
MIPFAYIAAIMAKSDHHGAHRWPIWRSRILYAEQDARDVLHQWRAQFGGLFEDCDWVVLPLHAGAPLEESRPVRNV